MAVERFGARLVAADTLVVTKKTATTTDPPTPYKVVTTFNNFYEFGSDKGDPAKNAKAFKPKPWSVAVEGACGKPGVYTLEDILKPHPLEERIYRHRCVEGWSIVVPWIGFPLADLLKRFEPPRSAKFVEFVTVLRPEEMPGQRGRFMSILPWPYNEGLRIDEAMHPLALIAVGLYGEELPNQNGAPLRLVVPWKYGFKSIKSIVKIRFVEKQPPTTWMKQAPRVLRLLLQREPGATYSTFRDQSSRAPSRRVPHAQDAAVQRLRRSGRVAVRGDGPATRQVLRARQCGSRLPQRHQDYPSTLSGLW